MKLVIHYFASLRDAAQKESEIVEWEQGNAVQLYEFMRQSYGFSFPRERVRLVANNEIVAWNYELQPEDEIVFLPPVSGG